MRIIFMGTPEFALPALEALLQSYGQGEAESATCSTGSQPREKDPGQSLCASQDWQIVAAYSQPPRPKNRGHKLTPSPVHALAESRGIPVYTPTSLKSEEAQAEFAALKPDLAVVVAYGLILPQAILDAPTHGCINIHPSALPRWRGAAPIQRPIMAGDEATEICIMRMDTGLDTGDVYLRSTPIEIGDKNAGQMHDLLAEQAAPLLLETIQQIANGTAKATPQASEGITYADKISKEEARIDWSKSAMDIHNHIRGLSPFPGATTMLDGEALKVYAATPMTNDQLPTTSQGVTLDDQLTIACGEGNIQLLEIQKPGKPRMSADAFLRGHPVAKGTRLS